LLFKSPKALTEKKRPKNIGEIPIISPRLNLSKKVKREKGISTQEKGGKRKKEGKPPKRGLSNPPKKR